VIGGDLVVHSKAGVLQRTSITQAKPLNLSTTPVDHGRRRDRHRRQGWAAAYRRRADLAPGRPPRTATPKLAHDVSVRRPREGRYAMRMHYYVDANSGAIIDKTDAIKTGTLPGTGVPDRQPAASAELHPLPSARAFAVRGATSR
jgi:hypothetical protein